jgi:methylenetetrahydrofolate dehydrogenase (NADP+)/methenyltetrahydrofolate cyclohydrolase/formyltetrahydrofolate synthetase
LVEKGCANLIRHIENSKKFGIPVVVALNRFSKDTEAELNLVLELAKKNGAFDAVLCEHFSEGGAGAVHLAQSVINASNSEKDFKFLYDLNLSIEEKIRTIAKEIYRANDIELSTFAQERIDLFKKQVKHNSFIHNKFNLMKFFFFFI